MSAPRGGIWNEDPECHDADPEQLAEIDLRAGGGQAAFLVGETPVTAAGGRGANEFYGFDDQSEEHTRRYRQFAQRIHDNGALALVELCHVGQAKSEIEGEEQPIGPMELTNGDGVFIRAVPALRPWLAVPPVSVAPDQPADRPLWRQPGESFPAVRDGAPGAAGSLRAGVHPGMPGVGQ